MRVTRTGKQTGKTALRKKAEEVLASRPGPVMKKSRAEADALIHDLELHQIELEMQNDELRRTQNRLEESNRELADLYDYAPVGYLTLGAKSEITKINLTATELLGYKKRFLAGKPFTTLVHRDDQDTFYLYLKGLRAGTSMACEIRLYKKGRTSFDAQLVSVPFAKENTGPGVIRVALFDISERKSAESAVGQTNHSLGERIKELSCLYQLFELTARAGIEPAGVFRGLVTLIPPAWQYSQIAVGRIVFDGETYQSGALAKAASSQRSVIRVSGRERGFVEAIYTQSRPESFEGPFQREERRLIDALAERLGQTVEQHETLKALRESEERYRSLFENANDGIFIIDPDSNRILDLNPSAVEQIGHSRDDLVGSLYKSFHQPGETERIDRLIRGVGPGQKVTDEHIHSGNDSVSRFVEMSGVAVNLNGRMVFQSICRDITERKQAELALRESEERLKSTQKMAHLGSWEFDVIHGNLIWSDEVYRIFGFQPREFEATYEAFLAAVHPDDRREVDAAYSGSLKENSDGYEIEHRIVRESTGEIRIVHEKCYHVRDESGRAVKSIGMVHDITGQKQTEETITRQLEELTATNKELESFSYSIAHDLRAPLRTMTGFSNIIVEDFSAEMHSDMRDYFDRIVKSADKMDELITDMLSLASISRQEMNPQEIDLSAMADSIIDELHRACPERKVEISIAEGIKGYGDKRLMHIVLSNLFGNAWKYSSKKSDARIEFGMRKEDRERVYYVRDNGAGFDMTYAEMLFAPFKRLHSDTQFPGTGIGLATVHRVLERHKGRIWAESEEGKGATFYFTLLIRGK